MGRPTKVELSPFGQRLREAIDAHPSIVNRSAFLAEAKIQGPVLYRYETGEQSPRSEQVEKWASVLGCSAAWLQFGSESTLDTSTAQTWPLGAEEDVEWAIVAAELDADDAAAFRRERRYHGRPYGRQALLAMAMDAKTPRKVVDNAQAVVVTPREGTMMLGEAPKKRR